MTNIKQDPTCIVCKGSGVFTPEPGQPVSCPLCEANSRLETTVTALHRIADYGKSKPNQPFIRAFHRETIEIAESSLKELEISRVRFGNVSELLKE